MAPVNGEFGPILSRSGTGLKTSFTMPLPARYAIAMLLLLAAAAASASAPPPWAHRSAVPVVQARATVRILSGASLRLGHRSDIEGQRLRDTHVETREGIRPARLLEFE